MDIKNVYDSVLAQFAAESYLDNLYGTELFEITNAEQLGARLRFGANRYDKIDDLIAQNKLGPTQMTNQMITDFENTWQIITHLPNQISGFSATLLQHKTTAEFTLSFRGSEPKDENDGGDKRRDVYGADAEIVFDGFSFAQIQDMEEFYEQIKNGYAYNESTQGFEADASLNEFKNLMAANGKLNITGYSLGGHLAQIFTLLHYDEVLHAYTFNGAGFGDFPGLTVGAGTIENYAINIEGALLMLEDIQRNPLDYINRARGNDLLAIVNILEGKGLFENLYQAVVETASLISLALPRYQGEIVNTAVKLLEFYRNTKLEGEDKELLVTAFQLYHDEYYQFPDITLSSRYADPLYLYAKKIVSRDLEGVATVSLREEILNDYVDYGREQVTPDSKITNTLTSDRFLTGANTGQFFESANPTNTLTGTAGNDIFNVNGSTDLLDGGAGDDVYFYQTVTQTQILTDASGNDTLVFGDGITVNDIGPQLKNGKLTIVTTGGQIEINRDHQTSKTRVVNELLMQ